MNLTVFRELILALVALATLSIVVVPTAHAQCPDTPLDSDTSSGFTLDFCGVDYDIAAGTSTWTYSLSWDYTPPPLSHFTFELCSQATVLNASPLPYDRIGNDPTTGLYGIVWDQSAFSLPQNISFTLDGLYALGTAQWAPKAGVGDGVSPDSDWFLGLITGPEVNCSIVECISDANCSDDSSCGIETCDPATLTCNSEPLNCDDGVSCTDDACDPVTDSCTNTPYDSYCDDGQWCNGPESCDPVNGCQAGAPVVCDDGVACTMDACDEAADSCSSRPMDLACDDGQWCNGPESCDPVNGCQAGAPVDCSGLADECNDGVCDEASDACTPEPKPVGTPCGSDADTACTEPDTCDGAGFCQPNNELCGLITSSALCMFDVQPDKGVCTLSGDACLVDPDCEAAGGTSCAHGWCEDANGVVLNPAMACTDGCAEVGDYCEQTSQFRLVFTPDVKNFPAYKLNASNPGQTYYNMIVLGGPGDTKTVTVTIPWPFVSVGGQPVHVYDGEFAVGACVDGSGDATGQSCSIDADCGSGERCDSGCFAPGAALQQFDIQWTISDYSDANGPADSRVVCDTVLGPNGVGACSFDVDVILPASGVAYVNVHLDYGLKGRNVDANPVDGFADRYLRGQSSGTLFAEVGHDALVYPTEEIAISDCKDYQFWHFDGGIVDDSVQGLNAFKPIAGVFGLSQSSLGGAGYAGLKLALTRQGEPESILRTATTDEDGFYFLPYKHKGKPAFYDVRLYDESGLDLLGSITVELQGNGWTNVNFDSYATYEEICDSDKAFCECSGWCAAAEYGSGRQSGGSDGGNSGGSCDLAQTGGSCTADSDCCSNSCKGKPGNMTCK